MSGCIQQCWKFVTNFGLQWSLQNITKLYNYQNKIVNRTCLVCTLEQKGCRKRKGNQKNTHCWCKMVQVYFVWLSPQELKTISTKHLNHQHLHFTFPSQRNPMPQEVFPTKSSSEATAVFVLHIHGRLGLQEPLHHGNVAESGCHDVQRCPASGAANPRRKPQGRTQTERSGEKVWENFGHLKSRSLGKLWPLKILPRFKLTLYVWDVLRTSSWLKKLLPLMFYRSRVSHVGNQNVLG